MRINEFKKNIKTEADLEFYNILMNATKNHSSAYETRFMAIQLYKGTLLNAYKHNAPSNYINFMSYNLNNMILDSFGGIGVMVTFDYILQTNFSGAKSISVETGVEVTSKTLQYLLEQIDKYEYIHFMASLTPKLGLSNDFKNEIVDYFMENAFILREHLSYLNKMKTDMRSINEWLNFVK